MTSPEDLADLLARCALNDRKAFERLYRETSAQLFGLILRTLKNRDLSSEVLQEGYVKIWTHAGEFRADRARPMTWMGTIMRNQAIDLLRRSSNRPQLNEPVDEMHWLADETEGPLDLASRSQEQRVLHDCLGELKEIQRKAVTLAYFEGLTHEELAERLDTPLGTIKSWLRRGLLRLKKCLEQL
jgi:RNA polymerase sigma-70 factor (ECF subfamily)